MMAVKKIYMSFLLISIIGFILSGVLGCVNNQQGYQSVPPNVEEYASFPKMVVGDTWIFTSRAEEYGGSGIYRYTYQILDVKKEGDFVIKVSTENGKSTFLEYYDNQYRKTKILNFKTGEEIMEIRSSLSPPTMLKFPLYVGLRWKETYNAKTVVDHKIVNLRNEYEVKKYEQININGNFEKAYQIVREMKNTQNPSYKIWQKYWYVPAYKRIAKIDSSYTTPIKMLSYSSGVSDQHTAGSPKSTPGVSYGATINDKTPPVIKILSHDLSRGIMVVSDKKKVHVRGIVTDDNGIVEVTVDGREAMFSKTGYFEAYAYLGIGENRIAIRAFDRYGNRAEKILTATRKPHELSRTTIASDNQGYYALIIGNNDYRHLKQLETAHSDAEGVASILRLYYGFDTKLLLDATRGDILSAMNDVRKRLKPDDNLLIYYAGHGIFDRATNKAYWLPVDAKSDDDTNWIIVDTITSNVRRISANHVLIVADSCYSGTFTRKATNELQIGRDRGKYLKKMRSKSSRTLMASGGNEPVSDVGGKGHSVFAAAFITALESMHAKTFLAEELFYQHIKERVAGSALQTPEYNVIRNSGHEGGDFIFVHKDK